MKNVKKRILNMLILCLVFSLFTAVSAFAANSNPIMSKSSNGTLMIVKPLNIDNATLDRIKAVLVKQKAAQSAVLVNGNKTSLIGAPAAPLTYLEVYGAISTNYPSWEYFTQNQMLSSYDHGGAELYIATIEVGYGHLPFARINGNHLSQIQHTGYDLDSDGVIDTWVYIWNASGSQGGQFTYENTSTNSPWNKRSDSINIR